MSENIKAIIFGVTGMVGEGVLHECLNHSGIESVLIVNRRPCGIKHKKLTEIIHKDFFDLSSIKHRLQGFNACYYCAGIFPVGKKESEYKLITYDLTISVAKILAELNPEMSFCYVSGTGTDSSEAGKNMWARIKGKTENELLKMNFKSAYMFRPGYINPIKGLANANTMNKILSPFYPLLSAVLPKYVCTLEDLGKSMINSTQYGYSSKILENVDIKNFAEYN